MTPIRILAPSLLAFVFASCAAQKADTYDTANPYGTADAGQVNAPVTDPANPVYDTPAAYEESTTTAAAPAVADTNIPAIPAPSNGAAIIHSGISSKYKVPAATIKQANRMTNDTVVLGRKMVIPPVR